MLLTITSPKLPKPSFTYSNPTKWKIAIVCALTELQEGGYQGLQPVTPAPFGFFIQHPYKDRQFLRMPATPSLRQRAKLCHCFHIPAEDDCQDHRYPKKLNAYVTRKLIDKEISNHLKL